MSVEQTKITPHDLQKPFNQGPTALPDHAWDEIHQASANHHRVQKNDAISKIARAELNREGITVTKDSLEQEERKIARLNQLTLAKGHENTTDFIVRLGSDLILTDDAASPSAQARNSMPSRPGEGNGAPKVALNQDVPRFQPPGSEMPRTEAQQNQIVDAQTQTAQPEQGYHPFTADQIAATARTGIEQNCTDGDCWYLAPLRSTALEGMATNEEGARRIASMITQGPGGVYKVVFPGDPDHTPVYVSSADIANDHLTDTALWAQVMEAALIKKDPEHALHGGSSAYAIQLLTDKKASYHAAKDVSPEELAAKLEKGPVVANTANKGVSAAGRTDIASANSALVSNHSMTLVSCKPNQCGNWEVIVQNPWGNNNGTAVAQKGQTYDGITNIGDGQLLMSWDTFQRKIANVAYQNG